MTGPAGERVNAPTLEVVGAGPSGLSAALAARAAGARATVYEKRPDVGMRFHGDFQGLENWTSDTDVLDELAGVGIDANFDCRPVYEFVCFDPGGRAHGVRSGRPIFYLVRRGSDAGTLDQGLKAQALQAGVEIHFSERRRRLEAGGIVAEGPHRADAIAAGYQFETDMADGCYGAMSEALAPGVYSYLLVDRGRGTIATCMFADFHNERQYVERTVAFFRRTVGLQWRDPRRFGGSGNFHRVATASVGDHLYVGEAPGFQDGLFGFGLRYALLSGYLAGRGGGSPEAYDRAWRARLAGLNAVSLVNRRLFEVLGDRGRRFVIRRAVAGGDPRVLLQRIYAPAAWKLAVARWLPSRPLLGHADPVQGCECTWCRCHRDATASAPERRRSGA